jgi:putative membrane protein
VKFYLLPKGHPLASGLQIAYRQIGMRQLVGIQFAFWAGFLAWNGPLLAQQANNPSDQFTTLGRRATTINQDVRQGPSNGTIVNQNNGGPTGNNLAGNGAGTGAEGPSPATFSPPGQTINPDRGIDVRFARRLVEHGMLKAEMGKLALTKGESEQVHNIGQGLIDDHARWSNTLEKIAGQSKIKLPEKLRPRYSAVVERLNALSGADFDVAFLKELTHYQDADLTLLKNESANGTVEPMRNWARKCVPGLERRLEAVREEHANLVAQK